MVSKAADGLRLKVFVSYCGADTEFADKLIQRLESDGRFEISFDPDTTIDEGDWKTLIGGLIADADAIVFVLSPDSAQTCAWEIEHAHKHSKRILPCLCKPLANNSPPAPLAELKYIRFVDSQAFSRAFTALTNSLAVNAEWLREHTRLLGRANQWEDAGRPNNLLLSGNGIFEAKMWTLSRPGDAPKPTDLHITFINMSEAVNAARNAAAHAAQAEHDELETLAHLQSQNDGFRQWANQAYMVVGCWLAILALVADWQTAEARKQVADARSTVVEICKRPIAQNQLALAAPVESGNCQALHSGRGDYGCLSGDEHCTQADQ